MSLGDDVRRALDNSFEVARSSRRLDEALQEAGISQQRRRMVEGYWVADPRLRDDINRRRMIAGDWVTDREYRASRRVPPRPYEGMPDALGYTISALSNLTDNPLARRDYFPVIPPPTPGTTQILPLDVKPEHPMLELGPENNTLQPEAPPLPWFEFDEARCPLLERKRF